MKIQGKLLVVFINLLLLMAVLFFSEKIADAIVLDKKIHSLGESRSLSDERYAFYKEYTSKLNHLRALDFLIRFGRGEGRPEDFLFTSIGSGKNTILIQGDSWVEQMALFQDSYDLLNHYAQKNDTKILIGGVGSYSPSLMTAQFNILVKDFNIRPKYVIAVLDQSDIGDELYRYKDKRVAMPDSSFYLKPFEQGDGVFDVNVDFKKLDILYGSNLSLVKLIQLEYLNFAKGNQKPDGKKHVTWADIERPLVNGLSSEEKKYIETVIEEYISTVFNEKSVDSLMIVTHRHSKHITGQYHFDIGGLVDVVVSKSKYKDKIKTLKLDPNNYSTKSIQIYEPDDPASHLTQKFHKEFTTILLNNYPQE